MSSDKKLDCRVSDYHIAQIADDLVDWESLAPYLELTESEQKEIAEDYRGRYKLQKLQALREWKRKNGDRATYRKLGGICRNHDLVSLAERIESYPGTELQPSSSEVLDVFQQHLFDCYLSSPHPATFQWPEAHPSLPLHAPSTYLSLNLQEKPLMEIQYPSNSAPSRDNIKPLTLASALAQGEGSRRMLVYFQGIGGSGKTTLSWHACREWAEKRLLTHFQLLIHVQMSRVKSATTLADIIPYPDKSFRQDLAMAIIDRKGRGICLLLDGLDEAGTELLDFLLENLLKGSLGKAYFPELSFVITSRPDWRITERLQSVLKTCIVLAGFNRDSLIKFLDNRLGADSEQKAILLKEYKVSPAVEGLCCHPVNAAIMSYVIHFVSADAIPTTQTMLHDSLVKHFLIRHFKSRVKSKNPCAIDSLLDDKCLPHEICQPFRRLCSLAYISVTELKQLFTDEDLEQAGIHDGLGLLNTRPTITMSGSRQYHSFYHDTVQEFLAAVHLSTMEENEQVTAVELFLGNNLVRSQVLPFYAGLTLFSNDKTFKVISESLSQAADSFNVLQEVFGGSTVVRQRAMAFIKCLFESQNESMMKLRETDLPLDSLSATNISFAIMKKIGNHSLLYKDESTKCLSLFGLPLTPLDCQSLGYYIRVKYLTGVSEETNRFFDFCLCSIGEVGMRLLLTEMKKDITERAQTKVILGLQFNQFGIESLLALKQLLQAPINIVSILLCDCFDPAIVDPGYALSCIIEGLANNSVCMHIDLSSNNFDALHIYHIILMLITCSGLKILRLAVNNFVSKMMPLFSHALSLSSLVILDISSCDISDYELDILGEKLESNCHLNSLALVSNRFTLAGFCNFLSRFRTNPHSRLFLLGIESNLGRHNRVQQIVEEINDYRCRLSHPRPNLDLLCEHTLLQYVSETLQQINSEHSQSIVESFSEVFSEIFKPSQ